MRQFKFCILAGIVTAILAAILAIPHLVTIVLIFTVHTVVWEVTKRKKEGP